MARALCNVGGVKCQPFLKHSSHWKWALEAAASSFLKLFVTSTVKESLCSTERGSLQVLADL